METMKPVKTAATVLALVLLLVTALASAPAGARARAGTPPAADWSRFLTYDQHVRLLQDVHKAYPRLTRLFAIGRSWQERKLWCLELSAPATAGAARAKTGLAVFANIHGREQTSAMGAAYTAWWLATSYGKDAAATRILRSSTVYVVPLVNPDGYEQSFIYPTRENLRPTDHNGILGPFSDPFFDTNGDGVIAEISTGPGTPGQTATGDHPPGVVPLHSGITDYESRDFDDNGIFGDDPAVSDVDPNRNFDFLWNYHDVTADPPLGQDSWASAGPAPASEPEVQAVQDFLLRRRVDALVSLHSGEQSVLWPWCYTPAAPADGGFMEGVAGKMAAAWARATHRDAFSAQSYDDYPTSAELIDWAWGRLGIHAYTQEVYARGTGTYEWGDEWPEDRWIYVGDWQGLHDIWFCNTGWAQVVGQAPADQDLLVRGVKDSFVVMAAAELGAGRTAGEAGTGRAAVVQGPPR